MYPSRPTNGRTATDDKNANQNLEVGDIVDVPGSMYGTIKFIGEVRGKKGHFAGVELSKEFAAKGKNDGDVDGWGRIDSIYSGPTLIMTGYGISPLLLRALVYSYHPTRLISAFRPAFLPIQCPVHLILLISVILTWLFGGESPKSIRLHRLQIRSSVSPLA